MKRIWIILIVLCMVPGLLGAGGQAGSGDYPSYYGRHGSAKFIGGTTVVVSIFADDMTSFWDFPLQQGSAQQRLYNKIRERMGIGLAWLEEQTARYGVKSRFIWDFDKYGGAAGLCYYTRFQSDLTSWSRDGYYEIWDYIHNNLDVQGLLDEYQADNILFAVHLNAPNSENYRSYSLSSNYLDLAPNQISYEGAVFVPYGRNRENTPALYAHELLHCFGAVDLYHASDPIPQSYVDHLDRINAFDLMNRCYYSDYDKVTTAFSDVDAYFVGLIPSCADVENYGLGPSIFDYRYSN